MIQTRSRLLPYLALIAQTFISALNYLVAKRALAEVDAITLIMLRLAGTAACFVPLLLLTARPWFPPRHRWRTILFLGLLGVPMNQGLFIGGLAHTSPSHAVLLYTLTPLFVFLIALVMRTEGPEPMKLVGLVLALVGAAVVVFEKSGRGIAQGSFTGDLLVLAAVIAWAGYTAFGKPLVAEVGPVTATGWTLVTGTILFLPIGIPGTVHTSLRGLTPTFWWAIAYLVIFTSIVAYLCWYYALGRLEPSRVAVFTNLQPVVTAVASWLLFGERITPRLVGGGLIVIAGVVTATHVGVRERLRSAMLFAAERMPIRSQE